MLTVFGCSGRYDMLFIQQKPCHDQRKYYYHLLHNYKTAHFSTLSAFVFIVTVYCLIITSNIPIIYKKFQECNDKRNGEFFQQNIRRLLPAAFPAGSNCQWPHLKLSFTLINCIISPQLKKETAGGKICTFSPTIS